jgi:hypothetical protein
MTDEFQQAEFVQDPGHPGWAATFVLLPVRIEFERDERGFTTVTFLTPNSGEVIFKYEITDSWSDDDDQQFILDTLLFGEDRAYAAFADALTIPGWWR